MPSRVTNAADQDPNIDFFRRAHGTVAVRRHAVPANRRTAAFTGRVAELPAGQLIAREVGRSQTVLGGLFIVGVVLVAAAAAAGVTGAAVAGGVMVILTATFGLMAVLPALICRQGAATGPLLTMAAAKGAGPTWRGSQFSGEFSTGFGAEFGTERAGHDRQRRPSFWESLAEEERQTLRRRGTFRTFPQGAALFWEEDDADHVIVILDGRARVFVHEDGGERVLAIRAAGDLVGERAALQRNVRSANVVALETVRALVLRTEDFARFVEERPHVLHILEEQIYGRLVERDDHRHRLPETPRRAAPVRSGYGEPETRRTARPWFDEDYCTVVVLDVAEFGAHERTDGDRAIVRHELQHMVREAFAEPPFNGLDRCHWEERGDGFLIVAPPQIRTRWVAEHLPDRLAAAVRRHNRRFAEPVRIRLRLAVHVGPVTSDEIGVNGSAIIHATRLADAVEFKERMKAEDAALGVIVSPYVYEHVVRHGERFENGTYERIQGQVKESAIDAWLRLIGAASY